MNLRISLLIASALALTACGEDRPRSTSTWFAGAPTPRPIAPSFPLPQNYITQRIASLKGKKRITLRYRVDMDPSTRIFPPSQPSSPSIVTLYFQRDGEDFSGKNFYRWYATSKSVMPIVAGEHEISASLVDDLWTSTISGDSSAQSREFNAALADAERVGFVLGGGSGYGHGVEATGPVTFTIVDWKVE